ncbi:hypothetical protein PUN28_005055 [Cardiocondyla obscurior]|uniref:Uncharacterized protein n=1 Tax=Cardiocondyla obscurior TaxID=286306 RepID=A0AAW2GFS4_9HYME
MYALWEGYYKINKIVLKLVGLWPYQPTYLTQIYRVLMTTMFFTAILVQLLVFVTTQYNKELLFRILSFVLPIVFVVMEYMLMIIKAESLKKLIEDIENDWNSIKDKLEIGILEEYANYIKTLTIYKINFFFFLCRTFFLTIFINHGKSM